MTQHLKFEKKSLFKHLQIVSIGDNLSKKLKTWTNVQHTFVDHFFQILWFIDLNI
jgi:hypothetical protein